MDQHVSNAKLTLKKNGKSFYWAGKFLPSASRDGCKRPSLIVCGFSN